MLRTSTGGFHLLGEVFWGGQIMASSHPERFGTSVGLALSQPWEPSNWRAGMGDRAPVPSANRHLMGFCSRSGVTWYSGDMDSCIYVFIFFHQIWKFSSAIISPNIFPFISFWYSRYMYISPLNIVPEALFFPLLPVFFLSMLPLDIFNFLSFSSLNFSSAASNQLLSPSSDFSFHICIFLF